MLLLAYICFPYLINVLTCMSTQALNTSFDKLNQIVLCWDFMGHYFPPYIQDLSGRPHLSCGLDIPTQRVGTYDTQVICEICRLFVIYQPSVQRKQH
jgi:hypothetical protein